LSSVDSTITAAVVSAVVSVAILVVSEFIIQPLRWKRSVKADYLEKKLETYGALVTIIDSMAEKSKRRTPNPDQSFTMENPYDYLRLQSIFEKRNYLLSKPISQLWLEFIRQDTYFHNFTALKEKSGLLRADFRKMQELAKKEYNEIRAQYGRLTSVEMQS